MRKPAVSQKKNTALTRRKSGLMALEPRFMFDGAAVDTAADQVVDATPIDTPSTASGDLFVLDASVSDLTSAAQLAQQQVRDYLVRATDEQLFELFNGGKTSPDSQWTENLSSLREALSDGSFAVNVVAMDRASHFTALAAFTKNGPNGDPTIFINTFWFGMLDAPDTTRALVEEMGHAFDAYLNPNADSAGDEGESFADIVIDGALSQDQSTALLTQNDHGQVVVNGISYDVEFASLNFSNAYHMVYDWDTQNNSEDTTERWASKEQNLHYFNTVGLGAVSISDGSNGTNFSGNDVSAVALTIGGQTYNGWISRPIKANGVVRGFYFWTDSNFTTLALAQADGNQDGDSSVADNRGFVLVVDQAWFTQQINDTDFTKTFTSASKDVINGYVTSGGTLTIASVGSSSDRVDSALNSVMQPNSPPEAIADSTSTDPANVGLSGGSALEAGGLSNATAGTPATGNVLTNDTDPNSPDTKTVVSARSSTTGTTTVSATGTATVSNGTVIAGTYGTLRLSQDGSYHYAVTESNSAVEALRTSSNTLSDTFTYTMRDAAGAVSSTTLTVKILGANDTPIAVNDYNTAKESLTSELAVGGTNYGTGDSLGTKAIGNVLPNDTDKDAGDSKVLTGISATADGISPSSSTTTVTLSSTSSVNSSWNNDYLTYEVGGVRTIITSGGTPVRVSIDTATTPVRVSITGVLDNPPPANTTVTFWQSYNNGNVSNSHGTAVFENVTSRVSSSTVNVSSIVGTLSIGMRVTGGSIPSGDNVVIRSIDRAAGTIVLEKASDQTLASYLFSTTTSLTFSSALGTTMTGQYGTLVFNSDGLGGYTYTPFKDNANLSEGQSVTESFKYTVRDAGGLTSQATLYITVLGSGANDPRATDDSSNLSTSAGLSGGPALEEGGTSNGTAGADAIGNILSNDTTPAGTNVVVSAAKDGTFVTPTSGVITLNGTYGTLYLYTSAGTYSSVVRSAGDYLYVVENSNTTVQALNAGDTLTDSFRYRIENGQTSSTSASLFDIASLSVVIKGADDAPVAVNDAATALEAGGVDNTVPGFNPSGNVLPNDTDIDNTNSQLTVASVRIGSTEGSGTAGSLSGNTMTLVGSYGTLRMNTDGSWSYEVDNANTTVSALSSTSPDLTEYFNYSVTDPNGLIDTATLTINIKGADDLVSVNDVTVNEGSPYAVFTVLGAEGTSVSLSFSNGTTNPTNGMDGTQLHGLEYWTGSSWATYTTAVSIGSSNQLLVRTALTPEQETDFDPNETFKLTVTPSGGAAVVGTGTIKDDNTGDYFLDEAPLPNGNPKTDPTHALNDDRTIDVVSGGTFNEASTYATFTVNGQAGYAVNLALGNTAGATDVDATIAGFTFEYSTDGGSTWTTYSWNGSSGNRPTIQASSVGSLTGSILVRVNISSEEEGSSDVFEGPETFTLTATYATNASKTDTDTATIIDDGTGKKDMNGDGDTSDANEGAGGPGAGYEDDRTLDVVSGGIFNEASTYATFTVNGQAGYAVNLSLGNTAGATDVDATIAGFTFEYSTDGGSTWTTYSWNGSSGDRPTIQPSSVGSLSGSILVRVDISSEEDSPSEVFEGAETFTLTATYATNASKTDTDTATIIDDGTGKKDLNGDGDTSDTNEGAGGPGTGYEDDRILDVVSGGIFNEASTYATFTVNGQAGYAVNLSLGNTAGATDVDATITGFTFEYSTDGGSTWTTYTWSGSSGNRPTIQASSAGSLTGSILVRVNISSEEEGSSDVFEGPETFTLTATYATNASKTDTDTATIIDDGTGKKDLNGDGDTSDTNEGAGGPGTGYEDDRTIDVVGGLTFNEGSGYATYTVTAIAGQTVDLILNDGAADTATISGFTYEYSLDGGSTWSSSYAYNSNATGVTVPGTAVGTGTILVRVDIHSEEESSGVQDGLDVFEGGEPFTFTARYTSNAGKTDTATDTIADDGTGKIDNDGDGGADEGGTKETDGTDTRTLDVVGGITFNEASTYSTFTVTGSVGSVVNLELGNTVSTADRDATAAGFSVQYNTGSGWVTYTWNGTSGNRPTVPAGSTFSVRVNISSEADSPYEGAETFTLKASYDTNSNITDTDTDTIIDDGTGKIDNDGNGGADEGGSKDDDRALAVNSITVNEGGGYAVFTVSANAGQTMNLALSDGTGNPTATSGTDYTNALEYWNPAANSGNGAWVSYTAGFTVPGASNAAVSLYVRVAITNDTTFENAEDFKLTASYTSGASRSAEGVATIMDDGTGTKYDGTLTNGSPTTDITNLNDDRSGPIAVTGGNYNENSPRAIFTVNAFAGQMLTLDVQNASQAGKAPTGDNEGKPNDSLDTAPIYCSLDGGATWQLYTGPIITGNVPVLVAVDISNERDDVYEGEEQLKLVVTSGSQTASGYSSIFDDGTGTVTHNITQLTTNDTGANDPAVVKDDDRPVPAVTPAASPPVPSPSAPPVLVVPPPPLATPMPSFASALTPLAPALVPVDPPMSMPDALTSGSGYQIPVNESAVPGLSLYQGITDQFVQTTGAITKVSLPFDAFIHSNKDAVIKLDAKQVDDSKLPSWVQFDPATGVFEVTPPRGFKGKMDLKVVARDDDGREAVAIFQMFIGEQDQQRPQSRDSFTEKLRMAGKRPITLVRVSDVSHRVVGREPVTMKVRAG